MQIQDRPHYTVLITSSFVSMCISLGLLLEPMSDPKRMDILEGT
jgi:hypothetical protein